MDFPKKLLKNYHKEILKDFYKEIPEDFKKKLLIAFQEELLEGFFNCWGAFRWKLWKIFRRNSYRICRRNSWRIPRKKNLWESQKELSEIPRKKVVVKFLHELHNYLFFSALQSWVSKNALKVYKKELFEEPQNEILMDSQKNFWRNSRKTFGV